MRAVGEFTDTVGIIPSDHQEFFRHRTADFSGFLSRRTDAPFSPVRLTGARRRTAPVPVVGCTRDDGGRVRMNAFNFLVRLPGTALQSDARERSPDLRELRYFHSVARTGNFSRSARELNVTQPAISHQVRKLEEGLGTQLLVRHGRGVALTPAGTCLRDRLETMMQLLASPLDDEGAAEVTTGTVFLAVPAETGPLLAAPLARQFRARWPDVALDIREGNGSELEEWVLHHRVDITVIPDPPALPGLEVVPILTETLGLVAPVHFPMAKDQGSPRLRDLVAEPLILPGRQHWIRRRVDSAAQQHGIRLDPVLQVNSVASTKSMVRNGLGCTILPLSAVQDEVTRGALAFRPISHPSLSSVCGLAFRRPAPSPVVAEFADIAREAMTALVGSGAWPGAQTVKWSWQPAALQHACAADAQPAQSPAGRIAI
jgi:LysR family transcriptional regulator, nitrogen assimilation regulatory protein